MVILTRDPRVKLPYAKKPKRPSSKEGEDTDDVICALFKIYRVLSPFRLLGARAGCSRTKKQDASVFSNCLPLRLVISPKLGVASFKNTRTVIRSEKCDRDRVSNCNPTVSATIDSLH